MFSYLYKSLKWLSSSWWEISSNMIAKEPLVFYCHKFIGQPLVPSFNYYGFIPNLQLSIVKPTYN